MSESQGHVGVVPILYPVRRPALWGALLLARLLDVKLQHLLSNIAYFQC